MPPFRGNGNNKKRANRKPVSSDATAKAAEAKQLGNDAFIAKDYLTAYGHFSTAISHDPKDPVFYSNRSGAAVHLGKYEEAIKDAEKCLELSPEWAKGFSRLGAALMGNGQISKAIETLEKGLTLDPTNTAMQASLAEAQTKLKPQSENKGPVEPVIGIDLGTTYSCVGVWMNGQVEILEDEGGNRTVPSYVAWNEEGERLTGHQAKNQAARNLDKTVYDVKRILGQRMTEPLVQQECKNFAFNVEADASQKPVIKVGDRDFSPEEISSMILTKMKEIAETKLGMPVKKAVITTPAYFNDAQRQATKAAGQIAGLEVLRIINEPTAAAIAYGLDQKGKDAKNVLIFDLGGGTFDVSILKIDDGMFEVKATGGDTHLGGEDFDNDFVTYLAQELKKQTKGQVDITNDKKAMRRLKASAEKAKRDLSSNVVTKVEVMVDGEDYLLDASRAKFEEINKAWFEKTLTTVKQVMKDSKLENKDINDVVLVGGSTRIPKIQALLSEYFDKALCKSINPDEAVAYGAAVQAAILGGVKSDVTDSLLLVDVTPLSLGVETEGKHMSTIIPRNTSIPCKRTEQYTTTEDFQTGLEIKIFEGERVCTEQNHLLGEFDIKGVERAKKGVPQIEVTFALDSNGILSVTARDRTTGATADCTISDACKGLSAEEIDRMLADAEKYKEQDELVKKKVAVARELDELQYRIDENGSAHAKSEAADIMEWLTENMANVTITELEAKQKEMLKLVRK